MEQKIKVKPNQSFLDVILQGCGALEAGMLVAAENDISISILPDVDSPVLIIQHDQDDKTVLKYLAQSGIVIGTLGDTEPGGVLSSEDDSDILVSEDGDSVLIPEN